MPENFKQKVGVKCPKSPKCLLFFPPQKKKKKPKKKFKLLAYSFLGPLIHTRPSFSLENLSRHFRIAENITAFESSTFLSSRKHERLSSRASLCYFQRYVILFLSLTFYDYFRLAFWAYSYHHPLYQHGFIILFLFNKRQQIIDLLP